MGKRSMIADVVLAALLFIFAGIYDATVIAAFANLTCVQRCVMSTNRRFAPSFQNHLMFVMVAKRSCPVHWRREFTLLHMHKGNTRQYALRAVRVYRLLKMR
jgi:hypothetical protein